MRFDCSGRSLPITEERNQLTEEIDVATPTGIVDILRRCEVEIFHGWNQYPSLLGETCLRTTEAVVRTVRNAIKAENGRVIFSGCGTSGRVGYLLARCYNDVMESRGLPQIFRYSIAGGDKALFTSQEAPEDDPISGTGSLEQAAEGADVVVLIGITCGLSAPFVAGQLVTCLGSSNHWTPVLFGFNPVSLARNNPIDLWEGKTFRQVADQMQTGEDEGKAHILNPIVGPEPITGSSRMKGGTATKLLLEAICTTAIYDCSVESILHHFRTVSESLYKNNELIGSLIQDAGSCMSSGGNLYYLGWDTAGLMGLMDASECPPTYGATLDDVRGFVAGGYSTLRNTEGDISHLGKHFRIDYKSFADDILPTLRSNDFVLILVTAESDEEELKSLVQRLEETEVKLHVVTFRTDDIPAKVGVSSVCLPVYEGGAEAAVVNRQSVEYSLKLVLNAVSTAAHIAKGKVYRNIMIDLKVSNNKLFHRAVRILQLFSGKSDETCRMSLLRAIYETEQLSADEQNASVTEHILKASLMEKVVPTALMMLVLGCTLKEAQNYLENQPIIRAAVNSCLNK